MLSRPNLSNKKNKNWPDPGPKYFDPDPSLVMWLKYNIHYNINIILFQWLILSTAESLQVQESQIFWPAWSGASTLYLSSLWLESTSFQKLFILVSKFSIHSWTIVKLILFTIFEWVVFLQLSTNQSIHLVKSTSTKLLLLEKRF